MYPVLSVLRRAAVSYVYVRRELLVEHDGALHARMETDTNYLELEEGKWSVKASKLVPIQELVVDAENSESAAISLSKRENDLADSFHAEESVYTLILGPEREDTVDGRVVRRARYAVVRGVYRAASGVRLRQVAAKDTKVTMYTRNVRDAVRLD